MMPVTDFSQRLRALGQALEALNVSAFEVEPDGGDFLVRGDAVVPVPNSIEPPFEANLVREMWGALPGQRVSASGLYVPVTPLTVNRLELRYTVDDIERLEREGQGRRRDPGGAVDPGSVSQLLRTIGAYVNRKPARLVRISQEGKSAIVAYQTFFGSRNRETLSVADLYDFWIEMYMRRCQGKADSFRLTSL